MYDYIEGELVYRSPGEVVIDAGGVGYSISVPLSTYEKLPRDGKAKLYTHFHVREDCQKLYGFISRAEREIFIRLDQVSSIGPETALKFLSAMPAAELQRAVAAGDVASLTKVKGVGRKTAERVALELRDVVAQIALDADQPAIADNPAQAMAGLVSLGYKRQEARNAVDRAVEALGEEAPVEDMIREALRHT